jgi:hypothetical protein
MPFIHPKGSPNALVWLIVDQPCSTDKQRGFLWSGGAGYVFQKMLEEAEINDYYVTARRPDPDHLESYSMLENDLNHYRPTIIICLDDIGEFLCDELKQPKGRKDGEEESRIEKYAGSLLISPRLNYPHFVIPTYGPEYVSANWSERDIITALDLGKAKSELDYLQTHGGLEPLPTRKLVYNFDRPGGYDELVAYLDRYERAKILSNDIESVYPKKSSPIYPHPGYPITVGLADCKEEGISFKLFRDDRNETRDLWRRLYHLLKRVRQLGQNFFHYDLFRYDCLGFDITVEEIEDTYLRHTVLWPELQHSLQFLTRQYTREPYYKDEGQGWSLKQMDNLKRYNCLDVCVTFEVYEAQEREFNDRPHLK